MIVVAQNHPSQKSDGEAGISIRQGMLQPLRMYPSITALILLNLTIFAILCIGRSEFARTVALLQFANWGPAVFYGEWYRMIVGLFIHLTWVDLIPNMVVLGLLGRFAERDLGTLTTPFYMVSGCGANLASLVFFPNAFGRGASGAILGLLGFLSVRFIHDLRSFSGRGKRTVLVFVACCLAIVVEGAFDRSPSAIAHVSGTVVGVALGILFQQKRIRTTGRRLFALAAFAVLLFAVASPSLWEHRYMGLKYAAAKHYDQGDYKTALEDIDRYLELEPASREGNLISANIHFRMQDYSHAENLVRVAMAKDPQDTYSLYFIGVLEVGNGRCDEATLTAQNLFRYYSQYASALYKARCPDEASHLSANLVRPSMANDPIIWLPEENVMALFP